MGTGARYAGIRSPKLNLKSPSQNSFLPVHTQGVCLPPRGLEAAVFHTGQPTEPRIFTKRNPETQSQSATRELARKPRPVPSPAVHYTKLRQSPGNSHKSKGKRNVFTPVEGSRTYQNFRIVMDLEPGQGRLAQWLVEL
jgi:hypothetical protein